MVAGGVRIEAQGDLRGVALECRRDNPARRDDEVRRTCRRQRLPVDCVREVAKLAGVQPVGLQAKRRTIITFDASPGTDLAGLPFAKTVGDELYFAPESGRLFASPMDEVPSDASVCTLPGIKSARRGVYRTMIISDSPRS